ncbi:hypothetical protein KCU95_g11104, partial [Aureobasidium melanogenum]
MTPTSYTDVLPQFPDVTTALSSNQVASPLQFPSFSQSDINSYLESIGPIFDDLISGDDGSTRSLAGDSGIGLSSESNTNLGHDFGQIGSGCENITTLMTDGDLDGDKDMLDCPLPQGPTEATASPELFAMANMFNMHSTTPNQAFSHGAMDTSGQDTHALESSGQRRKSSSCDCRMKCSDLLDRMAAFRADASPESSSCGPPIFEDVMEQNDSTIGIVREILDCTCSNNNNSSLYILCFVVFETLGWYAATALAVKSSKKPKDASPACPDADLQGILVRPPSATNDDSGNTIGVEAYHEHMIYQNLITKLYCVRRVGTSLSQRLLAAEEKSRIKANAKVPLSSSTDNTSEGRLAAAAQDILIYGDIFQSSSLGPRADGIWKSLEIGLRTRLKEVSQGIVEALREA